MPKACRSDQIRNPATGRCVKRTGKIGKAIAGKKSRRRSSRRKSRRRRKSLKPCKSHQYRHPETNRCRNKKSVKSRRKSRRKSRKPVRRKSRKPCKSNQYRNPATGRCKKKSARRKSRRKSRKPARKPSSRRRKPCKKNQVRNPATGRCVKRGGKIGRQILGQAPGKNPNVGPRPDDKPKPVGPGIPKKFSKIAEDCAKEKDWQKGALLGQGAYGAAYAACKVGSGSKSDCEYVLKSQKADLDFALEVQALTELQSTKIVPKLYAAWTCKGRGYLVIEKLYKCENSREENYKQMKKILAKLKKKNWIHVDTHKGNFMCASDKKTVVLIDFGWAAKKTKGVNQKYPDHPLSLRYGKALPWFFLVAVQDKNFEDEFGEYGSEAWKKADRAYVKARARI